MKLTKYAVYVVIAGLLLTGTVYVVNQIRQKNNQITILQQEKKALMDSTYAQLVDLGNKWTSAEKKLSELQIQISLLPSQITVPAAPDPLPPIEGTPVDSVTVRFSGENYLFKFNGKNRLSTKTFAGFTDLDFQPKEIKLKASIFQDADKSYYHVIESELPEIGIKSKFKIDKIALGLKPEIPKPEPKFRIYGIFGLMNDWEKTRPEGGVRLKFLNFNLDMTSARIALNYQLKLL